MRNGKTFLLALAMGVLVGCSDNKPAPAVATPAPVVTPLPLSEGHLIQACGVKFYMPAEASSHNATTNEFYYENEDRSVRIMVSNGKVLMNGQRFGMVKAGDEVSFINPGAVFVNGQQRKPE